MTENPKEARGAAKPSLQFIPIDVLFEVGRSMQLGAETYGSFNWREAGVSAMTYYDSTMRHLRDFVNRVDTDADSGQPVLAQAIAGLIVLLDAQMCGMMDDNRPPQPPYISEDSSFGPSSAPANCPGCKTGVILPGDPSALCTRCRVL